MKNQALFSLKDKSKKKTKCRLLQFLFGALRVKTGVNMPTAMNRTMLDLEIRQKRL